MRQLKRLIGAAMGIALMGIGAAYVAYGAAAIPGPQSGTQDYSLTLNSLQNALGVNIESSQSGFGAPYFGPEGTAAGLFNMSHTFLANRGTDQIAIGNDPNKVFQTYCVDTAVNIYYSTQYYYELMTFDQAKAIASAEGWSAGLGGILPSWWDNPNSINYAAWIYDNLMNNTWGNPNTTPRLSAAGQLAVWEVLYDAPFSGSTKNWNISAGNLIAGNSFSGQVLTSAVSDHNVLTELNAIFNGPNGIYSIVTASHPAPTAITSISKWILVPYTPVDIHNPDGARNYGPISQELLSRPTNPDLRVPDGGTSVLLLGMAVGAIAILRRKK